MQKLKILLQIEHGRTDLIVPLLQHTTAEQILSEHGISLINWIAYYGDVSALRLLVDRGVPLEMLGANLGLNAAAFHGHWQLCEYLIEQGANPDFTEPDTGETALLAALTNENRERYDLVLKVLLSGGANVQIRTRAGVPTNSLMRDAKTRGETPLHRAAVFGTAATIELLLGAGARPEQQDAAGESALAWASWARRPPEVLRALLYGEHHIHPAYLPLRVRLLGEPNAQ